MRASFRIGCGVIAPLVALLAVPSSALAWHDGGHATIAMIVYRQLKPDARKKLDEVLAQHPRYEADLLKGCPEGANKAEYAFGRAAVWPDTIRPTANPVNPMSAAYHRAIWHYTTVVYCPNNDDANYTVESAKPMKPGEPFDSLSAFKWNLDRVNDTSLPGSERAIALCWVLHLGGDIHQPMHNVTLYSPEFPKGDKGGNYQFFTEGGRRQNLHAIWDALLGDDLTADQVSKFADLLVKAHPRSEYGEQVKSQDLHAWSQEARGLAITYVYLDGKLKAAPYTEQKPGPDAPKAPELPENYKTQATLVSQKQAVLGAYRMGDALNALTFVPGASAR